MDGRIDMEDITGNGAETAEEEIKTLGSTEMDEIDQSYSLDGIGYADIEREEEIDWSTFMQDGVVVWLTIKRWRGTAKLPLEELGITPIAAGFDSFAKGWLKDGSKRLLPPDLDGRIKSIETEARKNLKACSYDCPMVPGGKFVPLTAYKDFKKNDIAYHKRFVKLRNEVVAKYNDMVEEVKDAYSILAEQIWETRHGSEEEGREEARDSLISTIVSQMPTADEIRDSFIYEVRLAKLPQSFIDSLKNRGVTGIEAPGTQLAAEKDDVTEVDRLSDDADLGDITAMGEPADQDAAVTAGTAAGGNDGDSGDGAYGGNAAGGGGDADGGAIEGDARDGDGAASGNDGDADSDDDDGIDGYVFSNALDMEIDEDDEDWDADEDALRREMEADIRSSDESVSASADSFIEGIIRELHTHAFDGADKILQSIEKNDGKLVGRSSIRCRSFLDELRRLNFYGDPVIKVLCDSLEEELCKQAAMKPSERKEHIENGENGVRDVLQEMMKAAELWADSPSARVNVRKPSMKLFHAKETIPAMAGNGSARAGN
jgi:hypothetical protein